MTTTSDSVYTVHDRQLQRRSDSDNDDNYIQYLQLSVEQ